VYADEYILPISYVAANKSDVRLPVDLILERVKTEFSVFGWQFCGGHALYH
jgi:hypothetical protein